MLAKNQINRNKMDNRAKTDKNNLDFMPFIQNDINGHIEWGLRGVQAAKRQGRRGNKRFLLYEHVR